MATLDEALRCVRRAGVRVPILVLFPVPADAAAKRPQADLELVVTDADGRRRLLAGHGSCPAGRILRVHLEIETGLQRGGVQPRGGRQRGRKLVAGARASSWPGSGRTSRARTTRRSPRQQRRLSMPPAAVAGGRLDLPTVHLDATGGLFYGTGASSDLVRPGLASTASLPAVPMARSEPARRGGGSRAPAGDESQGASAARRERARRHARRIRRTAGRRAAPSRSRRSRRLRRRLRAHLRSRAPRRWYAGGVCRSSAASPWMRSRST